MNARALRLSMISVCLALASCGPPLTYVAPTRPAPTPVPLPKPPPAAPASGASGAVPVAPPYDGPARPPARIARVETLSPAVMALVSQARAQASQGEFPLAAATLERAMRIEPDHPRLWIELGEVREAEHNYPQAEVMGRKALAVADDHATQALAWRLIAASLKAQGHTREAGEAAETARRLDPQS